MNETYLRESAWSLRKMRPMQPLDFTTGTSYFIPGLRIRIWRSRIYNFRFNDRLQLQLLLLLPQQQRRWQPVSTLRLCFRLSQSVSTSKTFWFGAWTGFLWAKSWRRRDPEEARISTMFRYFDPSVLWWILELKFTKISQFFLPVEFFYCCKQSLKWLLYPSTQDYTLAQLQYRVWDVTLSTPGKQPIKVPFDKEKNLGKLNLIFK